LSGRRHFERSFHRLALATGPLRELDVLLQKIRNTPDTDRLVPTSLEITLVAQRTDAQKKFLKTVERSQVDALLQEWRTWLQDFPQQEALRARWRIPAVVSIDVVVRDQCLALLRRGSEVDRHSPATTLHKLRIRTKRLRYLLEGFLPLFDQNHYQPLVQALSELQSLLGRHHDAVAMKQQLKELSIELTRSGLMTAESTALIDYWRRRARKRRRTTRKNFPAALQKFADAANRI
jgi:CHAD domain-containing protein